MDAIEIVRAEFDLADDASVRMIVWRVPAPVPGSVHYFKYRLALIVDDVCVLRYDNEAGKGDHRHVDGDELSYIFSGIAAFRRDFLLDARAWLERHGRY